MPRKESGFTLIELLIVVAIIGILAVLLIPNVITAIQKAKQKSTMKEIISIATAAADHVGDQGDWSFSQSGDITSSSDFVQTLTPFYINACPIEDHWGEPFKVYLGNQATVRNIQLEDVGPDDFVIQSYGRDGNSDGWSYDPTDTEGAFYTVDGWPAFKLDMVNWNGGWIRAPKVAQR